MASSTLKSARVALRKRFGQHLLRNPDVVRAIIDAADIQPDESVFEIGPGSGNMTIHLLEKARAVYAVELDTRLAEVVTRRVNGLGYGGKFFLTNADFLSVPLPAFDKLVANIPYQISSPVMSRLFTHNPPPKAAIIMFQLEFAQRIVAQPGTKDYSRLSVNSQLLSHSVRLIMKIGREQFNPPPKVDSAVVEIIPKGIPTDLDFPRWDCFLRICFGGKNKRLRSVLVNKHVLAQLARESSRHQQQRQQQTTTAGTEDANAAGATVTRSALAKASIPASAFSRFFSTSAFSALASPPSASSKSKRPVVKSTSAAYEAVEKADVDDDDVIGVVEDDDEADDAEDEDDIASAPKGLDVLLNGDVVKTAVGSFPRKDLLDVRAKIDAVIESLKAQEWRPNGMTVKQFRLAFEALEKAGLVFPPIKERVYPTAAATAAETAAPAAASETVSTGNPLA
jgi:18S rRNA (adenine1779-N6/adenine1780-N6)-dimethyltransferase